MRLLRDISIGSKLLLPLIILIIALAFVVIISRIGFIDLSTSLDEIDDIALQRTSLLSEFILLAEQVQSDVFNVAISHELGQEEVDTQQVEERLSRRVSDLNLIYGEMVTTWELDETERALLAEMAEPLDDFRQQAYRAAQVVGTSPAFGVLLVQSSDLAFQALQEKAFAFQAYQRQKIAAAELRGNQEAAQLAKTITAVSITVILLSIFSAVAISRYMISKPVLEITQTMAQLAAGDLDVEIHDREAKDEIGKMARAVQVFRENAAEKAELDIKLQRSEERYRRLSEATMEGIIFHDQVHLLDANRAMAEMLGAAANELIGKPIMDYVAPEHRDQARNFKDSLYEKPYELTLLRQDGSRFPAELEARTIFYGNTINRVVAIRDITERKQAEAERERLITELRSKNDELERFAYSISHDLKSPLFTIKGFLGFLEQDLQSGQSAQVQKSIDNINTAADKMSELLEDLLELSRIGRSMNPPADVALPALIDEALALVSGRLSKNKVEVIVAPDLPQVHGDRARLVEVFQNLVDNAAKFVGDQPHPTIEIGAVVIDNMVQCHVKDNGRGIEPRHQQRIFELFQRLDTSTEGTGIGLALVRRVVEVHGGQIWVESKGEGHGSTFYFTLPAPDA